MVDYDPLKKQLFEDDKIKFNWFICFSEDFVDALGHCIVSFR
jgi:hypothetical protein